MRRANAQRQSDRRLEILDAAQLCFARSGFHGASMQEICAEARMSPGNLYRYFPSKEALIAGICERNRAEAADSFLAVDRAPGWAPGEVYTPGADATSAPPSHVQACVLGSYINRSLRTPSTPAES